MSKPPFDVTDLDAYLSSERSPETCLQLSDLDGLLTAVAVSPSAIAAEEWLAVVWGGAAPVFRSAGEEQQVTGAILDRYHEIVAGLHQTVSSGDRAAKTERCWVQSVGTPLTHQQGQRRG